MYSTDAWVLDQGPPGPGAPAAELRRETFRFPALADDEVLVEPLYGSWEANLSHALARRPVDVCRARGDATVVLGNAGVVRVIERGAAVREIADGAVCLVFASDVRDRAGYMELAYGYDSPRSVGLLAKRTKLRAANLIELPTRSQLSLPQWAAFSVKYITAWANWRVAHGAWRLQMTEEDQAFPYVWGWGGGSAFAELDLARRHGCDATMISGRPTRLAQIRASGMRPVDRRELGELHYDADRYRADRDFRQRYLAAEERFVELVRARTEQRGASIFVDNIGTPVARATLRALARQGVVTTSGWKQGMITTTVRALEVIERHTHVHTHYARRSEAIAAMQYAERTGWAPALDAAPYRWDELPRLAQDYEAGRIDSYFSVFEINGA